MYYDGTLRWLEPFGGWGHHSNFFDYVKLEYGTDTGLCNRIFHWEVAEFINEKNNFGYDILLQDMFWPELEILDLPHTHPVKMEKFAYGLYYPMEFNRLKFLTVYDIKNMSVSMTTPITRDCIENAFFNEDYRLPKEAHSDFGYYDIKRLINFRYNPDLAVQYPIIHLVERPLQKIKIKYNFIQNLLENFTKGCVGIHIRRHNGVYVTEDDINSLPDENREDYSQFIEKTNSHHNAYKFIRDDVYFKIIDGILEINPNQKIYISSDIPKSLLSQYYNRYSNNLINNSEIIKQINEFLVDNHHDVYKLKTYGNVVENIVDLFSLSYCSFLIKSNKSTWSEFAEDYRHQPALDATNSIDKIIKKYIKVFTK
jgi:hypothetical protein